VYPAVVRSLKPVVVALALSCQLVPACKKDEGPKTAAPVDAKADPLDRAMALLLNKLAAGDYKGLKEHTVGPLAHDLTTAEFADLAAMAGWWGGLQSKTATKTDMNYGGGQRWYDLQFDQGGPVELEVSLDESGKLIGFHFTGEGYADAEHGVIAEQFREFKVYDFHYLDAPEGQPLPEGAPIPGNRIDYEIIVGGIEAMVGEHHLKIEKIVFDSKGKEVFHEPIEYDIKFSEDASGIPRGVVRGYLEVPGPGQWEMDLVITDQHARREIDYRHAFETVPPPKK
jgi:hypothetical protein